MSADTRPIHNSNAELDRRTKFHALTLAFDIPGLRDAKGLRHALLLAEAGDILGLAVELRPTRGEATGQLCSDEHEKHCATHVIGEMTEARRPFRPVVAERFVDILEVFDVLGGLKTKRRRRQSVGD